ncbi:hypothetical protein Cgig2_029791 [Carnegiea gigantea]|uniref:Uncharacterized protein n=1 Tax=Carnegiea gigantea TaxID=171969 RepID=A0A9Q1KJS4_9CARY|nr:hypothetical protein Cgig2_029791 [Carnegiea gigantea]
MRLLEVVVHSFYASFILTKRFHIMVFPYFLSTEEMSLHVLETFNWHLGGADFPHLPLPDGYQDLCLDFVLSDAEETTRDFLLPEIVQVIFYTMILNDALEMGTLSRDLDEMLKSALVSLRWSTFEVWLWRNRDSILLAYNIELDSPEAGRTLQLTRTIPVEFIDPRMEGHHPQFPSLPALIAGRVITYIPPKNQFREPKKITYAIPIHHPDMPSWSSCEHCSTPGILSIKEEVVYLWEINVAVSCMNDIQEGSSVRGGESCSSGSRSSASTPKRGRAQKELVQEVVGEGTVFPELLHTQILKTGRRPMSPT